MIFRKTKSRDSEKGGKIRSTETRKKKIEWSKTKRSWNKEKEEEEEKND